MSGVTARIAKTSKIDPQRHAKARLSLIPPAVIDFKSTYTAHPVFLFLGRRRSEGKTLSLFNAGSLKS